MLRSRSCSYCWSVMLWSRSCPCLPLGLLPGAQASINPLAGRHTLRGELHGLREEMRVLDWTKSDLQHPPEILWPREPIYCMSLTSDCALAALLSRSRPQLSLCPSLQPCAWHSGLQYRTPQPPPHTNVLRASSLGPDKLVQAGLKHHRASPQQPKDDAAGDPPAAVTGASDVDDASNSSSWSISQSAYGAAAGVVGGPPATPAGSTDPEAEAAAEEGDAEEAAAVVSPSSLLKPREDAASDAANFEIRRRDSRPLFIALACDLVGTSIRDGSPQQLPSSSIWTGRSALPSNMTLSCSCSPACSHPAAAADWMPGSEAAAFPPQGPPSR